MYCLVGVRLCGMSRSLPRWRLEPHLRLVEGVSSKTKKYQESLGKGESKKILCLANNKKGCIFLLCMVFIIGNAFKTRPDRKCEERVVYDNCKCALFLTRDYLPLEREASIESVNLQDKHLSSLKNVQHAINSPVFFESNKCHLRRVLVAYHRPL